LSPTGVLDALPLRSLGAPVEPGVTGAESFAQVKAPVIFA
jgi:hypothetical protein